MPRLGAKTAAVRGDPTHASAEYGPGDPGRGDRARPPDPPTRGTLGAAGSGPRGFYSGTGAQPKRVRVAQPSWTLRALRLRIEPVRAAGQLGPRSRRHHRGQPRRPRRSPRPHVPRSVDGAFITQATRSADPANSSSARPSIHRPNTNQPEEETHEHYRHPDPDQCDREDPQLAAPAARRPRRDVPLRPRVPGIEHTTRPTPKRAPRLSASGASARDDATPRRRPPEEHRRSRRDFYFRESPVVSSSGSRADELLLCVCDQRKRESRARGRMVTAVATAIVRGWLRIAGRAAGWRQ